MARCDVAMNFASFPVFFEYYRMLKVFLVFLVFLVLSNSLEIVEEPETECPECAAKPEAKKEAPVARPNRLWRVFEPILGDDFFDFPRLRDFPIPRFPELSNNAALSPKVDFAENDQEIVIHADVPGVLEDDLKVKITRPGVLSLTGRRTSKKKVKTDNYVHEEIESGSFQRSFRVPTYVKAADIHAELEHGVLTVRIPKEKEKDESNIVKINKK